MQISNIHGLRAFAAFFVVLFHVNLSVIQNGFSKSNLSDLFSIGNSGVDVFFLISGFVMVISTWEKEISILGFFGRRLVRIFPLYFTLTLAFFLIAVIAPFLIPNINVNWSYFLSSVTFTTAIFGYKAPILGQGWSLEYEMLFYLFFSVSLLFKSIFKKLILVSSLVLFGVVFGISTLFFEFVLGMLAAYIYKRHRFTNLQGLFLSLIGIALIFSNSLNLFPEMDRTLVFGIPSFILILGLSATQQSSSEILKKLGDSSYSLYLSQFFVIPFIFRFDSIIQNLVSNSTIVIIFVSLVTLLFGHFIYLLVEKPLTKITKRYLLTP
jgi:exopolysaccharide production protein ExoZ